MNHDEISKLVTELSDAVVGYSPEAAALFHAVYTLSLSGEIGNIYLGKLLEEARADMLVLKVVREMHS